VHLKVKLDKAQWADIFVKLLEFELTCAKDAVCRTERTHSECAFRYPPELVAALNTVLSYYKHLKIK
jgi:hypothetical protein